MKHSNYDVEERNAGAEAFANKLLHDDGSGVMLYGPCAELQKTVRKLKADLSQALKLMDVKHGDLAGHTVTVENALEKASCELNVMHRIRKSFIDMNQGRADIRYKQGEFSPYVILTDYTPPFAKANDTKAILKLVVWDPATDRFLRFDDNPTWDAYGTDYKTITRAKNAIAKISTKT